MKIKFVHGISLIAIMGFVLAACGPAETSTAMPATEMPHDMPTEMATEAPTEMPTEAPTEAATEMPVTTSDTGAADLRVALNTLLGEHVLLAASATNAALGGRNDEFEAAAAALDTNSVDLSEAIESVYGADAGEAFLALWRSHIGFFVDYTTGVATQDQAKQDKAVEGLTGYATDFGAFLSGANPNLTQDAVAGLVSEHVLTLKDVVDAQASGDATAAFTSLRMAYGHMQMVADALSGAIVEQFPDKFDGQTDTGAADLRVALNLLLAEHTSLAASATSAALGGRNDEFEAAAAALDTNSVDLSEAIESVYGADAGEAFLALWRSHIGFFVDYTTGVATQDQAKQDKAVEDLTGYATDFGAFLSGANPNLTQDAVAGLVTEHVLTLKDVVDAQASGDATAAFTSLRMAYGHMQMVADPLAEAIVQQFPENFQ
ncbi:MAG TPA: hypothetical protein VFQ23_13840 [Anaerolineales bacterium]|nr:hypothetical protein [Anaerolineales bacterium]